MQKIDFNTMHEHLGHNLWIEPVVRDNVITALTLVCLTCKAHDPEAFKILEDERTDNDFAWNSDYPPEYPCANCGHRLDEHPPIAMVGLPGCNHNDGRTKDGKCKCEGYWPA